MVYVKDFYINAETYEKLSKEMGEDDYPESSIFDPDWVQRCTTVKDGKIYPNRFWWSGVWSGHCIESLVNKVLPKFSGECDLIFVWEQGDSHSGIRLRGDLVTKHDVRMVLGEIVAE